MTNFKVVGLKINEIYSMISVVLAIYGGSSCVFIFNLMELTSWLDHPNVDIQPPLEYFFSCSIFNFKYSKGGPLYIFWKFENPGAKWI